MFCVLSFFKTRPKLSILGRLTIFGLHWQCTRKPAVTRQASQILWHFANVRGATLKKSVAVCVRSAYMIVRGGVWANLVPCSVCAWNRKFWNNWLLIDEIQIVWALINPLPTKQLQIIIYNKFWQTPHALPLKYHNAQRAQPAAVHFQPPPIRKASK